MSEALGAVQAGELTRIHPGSWINANYDIWIGAEEDNQGWEYLLSAPRRGMRSSPRRRPR